MDGHNFRRLLTLAGLVVGMGLASPAVTQVEFQSFSNVETVCPDCEKPKSDTVELTGGKKIRCTIVAENDDFLVVERFGEVRGIPLQKVASKSFKDGNRPSNLKSQDQIVLKNGHVLSGEIVDESDKPGHFQLKSSVGDFSYVVFKREAKALYRKGSKKTIEMPHEGSG
ncbi:MAG: hypothetical protein ABEN55_08060, partial [Bradymonadaceae bacterium]